MFRKRGEPKTMLTQPEPSIFRIYKHSHNICVRTPQPTYVHIYVQTEYKIQFYSLYVFDN